MEVDGKLDRSTKLTSTDAEEVACDPCKHGGRDVLASGYCQTCSENLCQPCIFHHSNARITRNHRILDKSQMTDRSEDDSSLANWTDACADHMDRFVEFFCKTHNELSCYVCNALKHQQCELKLITNMAKDFQEEKEYKAFVKSLLDLNVKADTFLDNLSDDLNALKELQGTALKESAKFRAKVDEYLDKREKEVKTSVKQMKMSQQILKEEAQSEGQKVKAKAKKLKTTLEKVADNPVSVFILTKRSQQVCAQLHTELDSADSKRYPPRLYFHPGSDLLNILEHQCPFGIVTHRADGENMQNCVKTTVTEERNLIFNGKIFIKSATDKVEPRVTGMLEVSKDILLLTDNENNSVKAVDMKRQKLCSKLTFSSSPWHITVIPNQKAAVTIPNDQKVKIISVDISVADRTDMVTRSFKLDGMCYGIAYVQGKLAVSFRSPGKLEIISLDGTVLNKFQPLDPDGIEVFSIPRYIVATLDKDDPSCSEIHVSDFEQNSVTTLSMEGEVITRTDDKTLKGPEGLAVMPDGRKLVCSYLGGNIHVLKTGHEGMEDVKQWPCVQYPQCVLVTSDQCFVYVTTSGNVDGSFIYTYSLI